jgi:hypothetical protein
MSTRAAGHWALAPGTHRLAGARAPLCLTTKTPACSPLPPCWRAQSAGLTAALPSVAVRADVRRMLPLRAAARALDSNPHSAVTPLAPEPMARGFLPRGLSDAYRRPR